VAHVNVLSGSITGRFLDRSRCGQRRVMSDFLPPAFRTASGGIPMTRRAQTCVNPGLPVSRRAEVVSAGGAAEIDRCDGEHGAPARAEIT
jgi:hypothetical protein